MTLMILKSLKCLHLFMLLRDSPKLPRVCDCVNNRTMKIQICNYSYFCWSISLSCIVWDMNRSALSNSKCWRGHLIPISPSLICESLDRPVWNTSFPCVFVKKIHVESYFPGSASGSFAAVLGGCYLEPGDEKHECCLFIKRGGQWLGEE